MRNALIVSGLLAVLLSGCGAPSSTAPATPPTVDGAKIVVSPPGADGRITVRGLPGAFGTTGATTALLDVWGKLASRRTVLHLGVAEFAIDSLEVKVSPDGSFEPVSLGIPGQPVLPEDEVNVTPYVGFDQAALTLLVLVPGP
jgi:hypothetical protein